MTRLFNVGQPFRERSILGKELITSVYDICFATIINLQTITKT